MDFNKLKLIISEEYNNFIHEDYADEDIIDTNDINLQQEYDRLNQMLFGGTLPRVPLRWGKTKRSLGYVSSLRNRFTGEIQIKNLQISAFNKMPYNVFKNVLAHEMIHVKQLSGGEVGGHGHSFYSEMRRINNMGLGFEIDVRSTDNLSISDEVKGNMKPVIGLILNLDGKYFLAVTSPRVYQTEGDYVYKLFDSLVNNRFKYRTVEITVVESTNPELLKYQMKRSLVRGISYGPLSDELLEQLLDEKILKNVKIERGKPQVVSENEGEWEEMIISEDDEWEEIIIS